MADRKITELANITGANLADADEFVVVDASADETKAITFAELKSGLDTATGFVRITGDTMTGNLDIQGTLTSDGLTVDKTATISTTDYYGASTFSSTLKGAATNTKAGLLLNSVSSSGQNAFASIHSEPIADFRASLIGTYSADGSGAGYFAINQFIPASSTTAERMRIDSSGNVGIGVSNPSSYQANADDLVVGNLVDAGTGITIVSGTASLGSIHFADSATGDDSYRGFIQYGHATNYMRFATNASEAMRITSTGNVGIGTSSPSSLFEVNKGSAGTLATFTDGVNSNFVIETASLITTVGNTGGSTALAFKSGNTERMRIDSSGNVGIGTSSVSRPLTIEKSGAAFPSNSNPSIRLNETSSGRFAVMELDSNTNLSFWNGDAGFGSTVFLRGSGSGTESMRIDSSGNVGIGTNSPAQRLHIQGSAVQFTNTQTSYLQINTSDTHLYTAAAHPLRFGTNSTERMRIDSSGNVGIGTSSPNQKLDVSGAVKATGQFLAGSTGAATPDYSFASDNTLGMFRAPGVLGFSTGGSERMRIDSSGNVGIGTSSPLGKVTIANAAGAFAPTSVTAANTYLQLGSDDYGPSNNGKFMIGFGYTDATNTNSPAYIGFEEVSSSGDTYGDLTFYTRSVTTDTAPSERLRIDGSGNLLVGRTSKTDTPTYGSAYIAADAAQASTNYYAQVFVEHNSATNHGVVVKELGTGGIAMGFLNSSASAVGTISTTASATAYNTSSDYRLKEDVQPMVGASDRVLALNPVNFAWKTDGTRVDGFLAHEAQAVVPEAVTGTHNEVDDDGNAVMQGIDQSKLVPLLTAALKEAITKIETLEARLDALEGV